MKFRKRHEMRRMLPVFIGFVFLSLLLVGCGKKTAQEPPDYASLTPQWKDYDRFSEYAAMSDGTRIAVDYYLPSEFLGSGKPAKKFPVILQYTPYSRGFIDLESGKITPSFSGHSGLFLSRGYAVAVADMRGTGASFGFYVDLSPQLCDDGKEIVDWIAAQPWCDGNVGMAGGSYLGWSQIATASRAPDALKCIVPMETPLDEYTGDTYPGGVEGYSFFEMWSGFVYVGQRNYLPPFARPSPPVVDEDGDGELHDEVPLDSNGNQTFLDDYPWPVDSANPPQYPDGVSRSKHYYFNATSEHNSHPTGAPGNYDFLSWVRNYPFIDQPRAMDGVTGYDQAANLVPGVMKSGIAVYHWGGWFDAYCKGSFKLFATMQATNPSRIMMPASYHQGLAPGFAELLGVDPENHSKKPGIESLRWYDRWLKGIDNGIDLEPPVLIYVMNGDGWRQESEWPLAREVRTKYYFKEAYSLDSAASKEGEDIYRADFSHNAAWEPATDRFKSLAELLPQINARLGRPAPAFTAFKTNRYAMFSTPWIPDRTEMDKKCLTYTSPPLEVDTEVTGHPIVHAWVSSTAEDGDFFFYLEDVGEDGRAVLISEYPLRAGFAGLHDDDEQITVADVDVKPDLPWHGYKKADYVDKIFAGKAIVELVVDLHPTSWVFKKGHAIRISIACADFPTFSLHPKLAPSNNPEDPSNIVPVITVCRDEAHPSHVELPVIPHR
ncbi:MAG: CocE/NonD family hydrolase [Candidatus Aminicenantes bacterium]|nr:CocE/NonD family hydrolase [Candidatus Aminicenantes bacterium]